MVIDEARSKKALLILSVPVLFLLTIAVFVVFDGSWYPLCSRFALALGLFVQKTLGLLIIVGFAAIALVLGLLRRPVVATSFALAALVSIALRILVYQLGDVRVLESCRRAHVFLSPTSAATEYVNEAR